MPRRILAVGVWLCLLATTSAAADGVRTQVVNLGSKNWKTRSAAYRALVKDRDPAAFPHLRRNLPGFDWGGQYYGVLILDRYPAKEARRTWRALLEAESAYLRLAAATALLRTGNEEGLEAGVAAVTAKDVTPAIRRYMLGRLGYRVHPRLLAAVRTLLTPGRDVNVLIQILTMQHRLQDRAGIPHVQRLLADKRPGVRALAAAFLYDLGHTRRSKELAEALSAGVGIAEFKLLQTILSVKRRVVDEVLDAVVERLSKEKNTTVLVAEMQFLGSHQYRKARRALLPFLQHENEKVARAAFDVLVELSGPLREDTLRPLLSGDDVGRKLWAAEGLRQRSDTAGIAVVIYALQSGTVPQRKDAARILGTYTLDLAVEPLLDALDDEHQEVRATALVWLQHLLRRLFPCRRFDISVTGYQAAADAAQRKPAIDQIRAWWTANRSADW